MQPSPSLSQSLICLLAGILLIVVLTTRLRVHAFFALFFACLLVGLGVGLPPGELINTIKDGFGNIMKSLGFIIVLGTALGVVLEYTGSTRVMAQYILRIAGERRAALAMSITGFIVGMPIFCDSGFIVLSGLNRTLAARTRLPLPAIAVSMATGLLSVHCLIPPHPGASAAAGVIGVDMGQLIIAGIIVAIPAAIVGHWWAARKATSYTSGEAGIGAREEKMEEEMQETKGPSVLQAFLPVVVPILLIAAKSMFSIEKAGGPRWVTQLMTLGDPVIALLIGVFLAFVGGRIRKREVIGHLLHDGVEKAGSILVIIGAGGAFGAVLAATHMGQELSKVLPLASMGLLFPFLLTAAIKTAQGSSTVAIITASSIIKPLLPALGLASGNGPLICVLSMGAGSMLLSHANDAYFWVISRFTGLEMRTMLRIYSVATVWMALASFLTIYVISLIL
jgi:GntP family gluconate:H+ symporter